MGLAEWGSRASSAGVISPTRERAVWRSCVFETASAMVVLGSHWITQVRPGFETSPAFAGSHGYVRPGPLLLRAARSHRCSLAFRPMPVPRPDRHQAGSHGPAAIRAPARLA